MTASGHLSGHDGQGNVLYPYVTGSCPHGGTGHGGRENVNGNAHDVTANCHDDGGNGNAHGATGTGQKTGTGHVVPDRGKGETGKSPDGHDFGHLTANGRWKKTVSPGTRSDDGQTATGFPCPPGLHAHEGGKTWRTGNGSDHQMIPPARLDPKRAENGEKNHPKRGRNAQQETVGAGSPTPSRNPKVSEEEERARPPRARPRW